MQANKESLLYPTKEQGINPSSIIINYHHQRDYVEPQKDSDGGNDRENKPTRQIKEENDRKVCNQENAQKNEQKEESQDDSEGCQYCCICSCCTYSCCCCCCKQRQCQDCCDTCCRNINCMQIILDCCCALCP